MFGKKQHMHKIDGIDKIKGLDNGKAALTHYLNNLESPIGAFYKNRTTDFIQKVIDVKYPEEKNTTKEAKKY